MAVWFVFPQIFRANIIFKGVVTEQIVVCLSQYPL